MGRPPEPSPDLSRTASACGVPKSSGQSSTAPRHALRLDSGSVSHTTPSKSSANTCAGSLPAWGGERREGERGQRQRGADSAREARRAARERRVRQKGRVSCAVEPREGWRGQRRRGCHEVAARARAGAAPGPRARARDPRAAQPLHERRRRAAARHHVDACMASREDSAWGFRKGHAGATRWPRVGGGLGGGRPLARGSAARSLARTCRGARRRRAPRAPARRRGAGFEAPRPC